jgi:hypothetical protein
MGPRKGGDVKADKKLFIRGLAEFLAGDAAEMSIRLEMQDPNAQKWAKLLDVTPLFGWLTVEEAEQQLTEWLLG